MLTYRLTDDEKIPSEITLGKYTTPVWIQQKWREGEYAWYIRHNGCGHCCTAMALNLHGIKTDPHEEFTLCRKLWGEPVNADNFISVSGIVKVLAHFEIKSQYFGVPGGQCKNAAQHIEDALKDKKSVILWSHPCEKLQNNPFSSGDHYVYVVGICEDGRILVANSSTNGATDNGIQFTDVETLEKVLFEGCCPQDYTWGRSDLEHCGGYIIIE